MSLRALGSRSVRNRINVPSAAEPEPKRGMATEAQIKAKAGGTRGARHSRDDARLRFLRHGYFKKLEELSRDELVHSAAKLVVAENGNIATLIAHLAEMSARKTALELGYKSLYDYCICALHLSEGAVPARIHVANVSRRFPQLLVALDRQRRWGSTTPRRTWPVFWRRRSTSRSTRTSRRRKAARTKADSGQSNR